MLLATSGLASALAGTPATEASAASLWPVSVTAGSSGLGLAGVLTAPTGVVAACATGRRVTVSWNAVTGAGSYTVEQSTTSATTGFTATATGEAGPSWTSANLNNGSTYWFRVVSVRGSWSATSTGSQGRTIVSNACS